MSHPGPQLRIVGLYRARRAGATWAAAGVEFGISAPRAYRILKGWLLPEEWVAMQAACRAEQRARRPLERVPGSEKGVLSTHTPGEEARVDSIYTSAC